MQNHLDTGGRSFSAMLQSSDPFGPPPSHNDYTTISAHNNGSPGSDFGHLLNSNNNHSGSHGGPINNNHLHHNNNNNNTNHNVNSNTNGPPGNGNTEVKPKKPLPPNGKKTKGRVKIKMEFIDNKLRRYTTFSKRKTGIMKKAYELSTLTGTQVMLLVASETGHVYTFATRKLQPMITSEAGKALIQTCLNSPDPPHTGSDPQRMSATGYEETELTYAADPNASDHGDVKDDDSESASSEGESLQKEVPSLLPLSNGLIPPNFAALLASAGLGNSKGGGLSLSSFVQAQDQNVSNRLIASPEALASAAHILSQSSMSLTPTSATLSNAMSSASSTQSPHPSNTKSNKRFRTSHH